MKSPIICDPSALQEHFQLDPTPLEDLFHPFQFEDIKWFMSHDRALNLYDPRLGKTVVTVATMALNAFNGCENIHVNCPSNALNTWVEHFIEWYPKILGPWMDHVYLDIRLLEGDTAFRRKQWSRRISQETRDKYARVITVWISTYHANLYDGRQTNKKIKGFPGLDTAGKIIPFADAVIADECHKRLRNRKSETANYFRALIMRQFNMPKVRNLRWFHATSGTLVDKAGPADMWCLLNIFERMKYGAGSKRGVKEFGSYWGFLDRYATVVKDHWGGYEILPANKYQKEALRMVLSRFVVVRRRKDVRSQMPEVIRNKITLDISKTKQGKLVEEFLGEESGFDGKQQYKTGLVQIDEEQGYAGGLIASGYSMTSVMRVRQLLACPRILDERLPIGAAAEDLVGRMVNTDEPLKGPIVVFTPFKEAFKPLTEYIVEQTTKHQKRCITGRPWRVLHLYGGISSVDQKKVIDQVRQDYHNQNVVVLCTISYAQAFSLVPANECFFLGFEWSHNDNKQAEDRLVGQDTSYIREYFKGVMVHYYAFANYDEHLFETIIIKQGVIDDTTNPLVRGADYTFNLHIEENSNGST